jgi:hypothetical protein
VAVPLNVAASLDRVRFAILTALSDLAGNRRLVLVSQYRRRTVDS